jgi:hypothetical protein
MNEVKIPEHTIKFIKRFSKKLTVWRVDDADDLEVAGLLAAVKTLTANPDTIASHLTMAVKYGILKEFSRHICKLDTIQTKSNKELVEKFSTVSLNMTVGTGQDIFDKKELQDTIPSPESASVNLTDKEWSILDHVVKGDYAVTELVRYHGYDHWAANTIYKNILANKEAIEDILYKHQNI